MTFFYSHGSLPTEPPVVPMSKRDQHLWEVPWECARRVLCWLWAAVLPVLLHVCWRDHVPRRLLHHAMGPELQKEGRVCRTWTHCSQSERVTAFFLLLCFFFLLYYHYYSFRVLPFICVIISCWKMELPSVCHSRSVRCHWDVDDEHGLGAHQCLSLPNAPWNCGGLHCCPGLTGAQAEALSIPLDGSGELFPFFLSFFFFLFSSFCSFFYFALLIDHSSSWSSWEFPLLDWHQLSWTTTRWSLQRIPSWVTS